MVKIYYTCFKEQLDEPSFARYLSLLPQEMQQKVSRFRLWQDSQSSLLGKLLLLRGLADMGLPYHLSEIRYTAYGRPYFNNAIDFNISHAAGCIACAFTANGKIGIDIEEVRPIGIEDFKSIFHEEEWSRINASDNTDYTFFHYWTAKEAIVKAEGKGLNIPLKKILIKNGESTFDDKTWYHRDVPLFDNCLVKIASDRELGDIKSVRLNFSQ